MPTSTRTRLKNLTEQAINHVDSLDMCLYNMDKLAGDRQPAIKQMMSAIIDAQEINRILWMELRSRL